METENLFQLTINDELSVECMNFDAKIKELMRVNLWMDYNSAQGHCPLNIETRS